MNRLQRDSNRANAQRLHGIARNARLMRHTCENCGEKGGHWVAAPMTLVEMLSGVAESGFWTCPKFYGPDGRRIAA